MKPMIFVFAVLSLFSLLAPTGCEEITQQNKDRLAAQIQMEQDAQDAAAKAQQLELAHKETQAREERALREKLERARHVHEQILRDKALTFWTPILQLGLVLLALAAIVILTIRRYSRHVLGLAQIHAEKETRLATRKLILEHWPELSDEAGIALFEGTAPPPPQLSAPAAPENSPEEKAVRLNNGTKPAVG